MSSLSTLYPLLEYTTRTTASPSGSSTSSPSSSSLPPISPPSERSLFSDGASPPLIVGFISIGAFALGMVSICAWRKYRGGGGDFIPVRYSYGAGSSRGRWRQGGELAAAGRGSKEKEKENEPAMFEAWRARPTADVLKWEESVPFSATLFTELVESECAVEVPMPRVDGDDGQGEEENNNEMETETENRNGKQHAQEVVGGRLEFAVLLQMPSPRRGEAHNNKVHEESLECTVGDELAIGIAEVSWAREDHYSLKDTTFSL